ncbi:MAG: DUF1858 domain-containing protein [Bacteroidales bacterium]|jgi:hypothetical protein
MEHLIISPKTKIYELLEAYPQLEESLIALAPPFKKLKNPVLRKTIAKITTLSQAAIIAGIKVEELINSLRKKVGQKLDDILEAEGRDFIYQKPSWFDESRVIVFIDISNILNAGEQPVHEVLSAIKKLKEDEILKVTAPFVPAPLMDKTISMNYKHWLSQQAEDEYWIFFKQ